jgi:hypothetical protein
MATSKYGVAPPQWWKHLREWKRVFWKRHRQAYGGEQLTPMDVRDLIVALHWPEWTPEFLRLHQEMMEASREGDMTKLDRLLQACSEPECIVCGAITCPHGEPLHFHHDGCPACAYEEAKT